MMKDISVRVLGKVQGVSYRYHTKREADRLLLRGVVRNLPDGSVSVRAVGEDQNVDTFLSWLAHGPAAARVDEVRILAEVETSSNEFVNFAILR